ncbi:MAG TPA: cbb3-type cytochrome c oxidase subunit I, partial [Polyangia bacterium]
ALHYWLPKMFGRMYHEGWGIASACFIIFGFSATFIPQFLLGNGGQPRRYYQYDEHFWGLNVASTAGATLQALGFIMILVNLIYALRNGAIAGDNPWSATGLEWRTTSPPPKENFEGQPTIDEEPYTYQKKGDPVEHVVV